MYSCEMSLHRAENLQSCWGIWRDKVYRELLGIGEWLYTEARLVKKEEASDRMEGSEPTVVLNMEAK